MASTWTAARSGSWSSAASNTDISPWDDGAGSNPNTGCPVAGDTVVIAAGCDVLMDVDIGAAGLANLTINGHATDPGVLYWKEGTSGTLVIASGGKIQGSSGARNGRILAGKTGIWPGASVSASLMASQYGATGVVTDGGGDTRVFTPAVAPNWDENGLAGESLTINGVTYLINSNTATAATLNAGPVVGAAVTSWVLKVRPLPVANTATINLLGTANITGAALDILLYSEEPTHRYVATYGQVFDGCICNTNNTLTGAAAVFPSNNMALALPNNTLVRVSADAGNSLPSLRRS